MLFRVCFHIDGNQISEGPDNTILFFVSVPIERLLQLLRQLLFYCLDHCAKS